MASGDIHRERAEAVYQELRKVQVRISSYESYVSRCFPDNDREVAAWLNESEEPEAWVYRTLCKRRASYEQIIATETAMAGLYS